MVVGIGLPQNASMPVRSTVYKDNKIGGIWVGENEILMDWVLVVTLNLRCINGNGNNTKMGFNSYNLLA